MLRLAPRWAVPGALAAAIAVMAFSGTFGALDLASLQPRLTWTTPAFSWDVAVAIALPLYVVTMTSQNIPGVTVLASFGYPAPMRSALVYTGATTALGAPAGGHAINLAAISAALAAGPEAGPDPARRWIAGVACGVVYMLLGPLSPAVAAASDAAPPGLLAAVAGLALIATFASSAGSALASEDSRVPAAVTFLVAASGVVVVGIGAAFWSLIAGLVVHQVIKRPALQHDQPTHYC
ncbi:benzoate/H(+) symporter BenE family transporter [Kocuria atrinae]|uniref:benzoate/H(+) symporter BenE family transporter n=1 Tax=Kocuria atrinae TaxID=592377 RepID=UPI0002DC3074|nr:benzoate/H(+) symporter BenE family transporter [Kocuria atrinae]